MDDRKGLTGNFYACLSFMLILVLTCFQYFELSKAKLKEMEKKGAYMDGELASLEKRTEETKYRNGEKYKIEQVLEKFRGSLADRPDVIAELIMAKSVEYGIDPLIILALIKTESSFRNHAVSKKGAVGLMQLLPYTAREVAKEVNLHVVDRKGLTDGRVNITLGVHYLAKLIDRFGNLKHALEAYNMGPSRLKRRLVSGEGVRYTYAKKVMKNFNEFSMEFSRL